VFSGFQREWSSAITTRNGFDHLQQRLIDFEYERFTVTTMNGNPSAAFQYLGRLRRNASIMQNRINLGLTRFAGLIRSRLTA
jgi:hypothetical protein